MGTIDFGPFGKVSHPLIPKAPWREEDDAVVRIRELSRLHDDGILTAEEFRVAKNKVIADLAPK